MKQGWDKATKLDGRAMSQGLLGVITSENSATVVEVCSLAGTGLARSY